jgi:hypothetical protein
VQEKKRNKRKVENNEAKENYKYINRSFYFGYLEDWEYMNGAMILKMKCYTATMYFGNTVPVRIFVPTDMEEFLEENLVTGDKYFCVTAPYKCSVAKGYNYRVELLLNIFKEIDK